MSVPAVSVGKSWLLNYEILRLVNQCRRLVDAEFGRKPALSQEDIWYQLADLAGSSTSRGTQRVYAELRLALLNLDDIDWPSHQVDVLPENAPAPVRLYRGQPVAEDVRPGKAEKTAGPAATTKTITYRGRTVQVA